MCDCDYKLVLKGAYIELTDQCNYSCPYCYNASSAKKQKFIDVILVKTILDEISKTGFNGVVFSGGEPFLHPSIFELIEYALEHGVKPTIITNASLLNETDIRKLLNKKLTLQLTFDGANAEMHSQTRDKSNYSQLISILNVAQELCCQEKINIRFNVRRSNYKDAESMIRLLLDFGIHKGSFAFLHRSGRGYDYGEALDWNEDKILIYEIVKRYEQIKEKFKGIFDFEFGELDKALGCAYFAKNEVDFIPRITPDGFVYPCQIFSGLENSLGNVSNYANIPLQQIAVSKTCNAVIGRIRSRKMKIKEKCDKCPIGDYCLGGCPATAYNLSGNIANNDEQCAFLKYAMKQNIKNKDKLICGNCFFE